MGDFFEEKYCLEPKRNNKVNTQNIVRRFLKEIGIDYKFTVAYYNDIGKNEFTLYTNKPGILIGKYGKNLDILKTILFEEYGKIYSIKIKEINGDFLTVNVNSKKRL